MRKCGGEVDWYCQLGEDAGPAGLLGAVCRPKITHCCSAAQVGSQVLLQLHQRGVALDSQLSADCLTHASDCIYAVYEGSEPLDRWVDAVLSKPVLRLQAKNSLVLMFKSINIAGYTR